ncbi:MAG: hypothetical protein ACRYG8_46440 [Janthinobacterium lividum]
MSSDHIDQPAAIPDPLTVMLAPEDADTAFAAGVQFARALAGAENAAFLMALGEQQALIHAAVLEAGYPHGRARAAGEAFEAGAREEWRRIASPERPAVWGTA